MSHGGRRAGRILRRGLPWLVAAAVMSLLLHRYGIGAIAQEIRRGHTGPLALWAGAAGLASVFMVALCDTALLRTALDRPRWRDLFCGKAGTGVLSSVNYGVGQGTYGLWIARRYGANARKAVGLTAFIMLCDLAAVGAIASYSLWLSELPIPASAMLLLRVLTPVATLVVLLFLGWGPELLRRWPRAARCFQPWAEIEVRDFALSMTLRIVNALLGIVVTWLAARSFGLVISLGVLLTYLPILFLVGSLPINIGGLGAVQYAWVILIAPHAESATQVIAFQFLFSSFVAMAVVARGLPFLGRVISDIENGRSPRAQQ